MNYDEIFRNLGVEFIGGVENTFADESNTYTPDEYAKYLMRKSAINENADEKNGTGISTDIGTGDISYSDTPDYDDR